MAVYVWRRLLLPTPYSGALSASKRVYSSWLRQIFGSKPPAEEQQERSVVEDAVPVSPSDHLKQLVQDHLPDHYTRDDWTTAPLYQDSHIKAQVLLSCEHQFNVSFTDRQLGSIRTPQDVLRLLSHPRKPAPLTVFPRIECLESLPANLSVYAASTQPSAKKHVRKPFQNYDSPEHAMFLSKQQKEARKRKRRHLTAIVKYYN